MEKWWKILAMTVLVFSICVPSVFAQHYVNGVEGIKAGSVPPPGMYYKMYNVYYTADSLTDENGDDLPVGFDLTVFANVHRFIWMYGYQLFGADLGADIVVPLIYTDIEVKAKGVQDDEFELGDICLEPLLMAWHGPRYDAAFGLAFYLPTGDYDQNKPASPGKDMWTTMFTLGGTLYFDNEKTWSASILARYEIHTEKGDTDITPGNDFHFEWGFGKTLEQIWDVGVTGYCHWQVSEDSGDNATDVKDQVYAMGPEVSVFIPPYKLFVSLRSQWEFAAEDRSEGMITTLTLTKIF